MAGGVCAFQPNQCSNLLSAIAGYNPDNVDEVWCFAYFLERRTQHTRAPSLSSPPPLS